MECEELGSCSSVCDAFVWGAVGGVSDALETLFARAVFGVYEGGTSWGGARLEHGGSFYMCVYIWCALRRAYECGLCRLVRESLLFVHAFICGGAALGGVMGGSMGI